MEEFYSECHCKPVTEMQLWGPNHCCTKISSLICIPNQQILEGFLYSFSYCCSVECCTYLYACVYQTWADTTENVGMSVCLGEIFFHTMLTCPCYGEHATMVSTAILIFKHLQFVAIKLPA